MGFAQINSNPLNGKKTVLFHGADTWVADLTTRKFAKATSAQLSEIEKDRNKYENYGVSDAQLEEFRKTMAQGGLPAPITVSVDATDKGAVVVTWDTDVTPAPKYYVVRWGINKDGQLDNILVGATTKTATIDMTTAAGKKVDVFVAQFSNVYASPSEALESKEYNATTAWSPLVTTDITA